MIFNIMPTTTAIKQSCGICIRIEEKKYIDEIISRDSIRYKHIYEKEQNEFKEII